MWRPLRRGAFVLAARALRLLLLRLVLLGPRPCAAGPHYSQAPCQSDEVQGEVLGASGYLCAPKCEATYGCATDMPSGGSAQPQCMLQDIDKGAYCGLLCQVDAQCPSGARCQQLKQVNVGLCLYSVSFADWAKQGATKKLAVGWPSQAGNKPSAGFQVAKTYVALQNLKVRYSIDDGDADMLTLKELLASLSVTSTGAPGSLGLAQQHHHHSSHDGGLLSPWAHDVSQFEKYASHGLPGIQEGLHDTIWNIEHIGNRGVATTLLRGVILVAVVYVAVGSLVRYQTLGVRGVEMLPHVGFWMDYPNLVADGILYAKILAGGMMGVPVSGSRGDNDLRGGVRGGAGSFETL